MKLTLYVGETRDLERCPGAIVDAERRGLHAAWLPGGLALDTPTVLALAASGTERIRLGAGIALAWPRHPIVLAQQALTVAGGSDGRLELGIGTGHGRMMEQTLGLSWERPVGRMLEYGAILREHGQTRTRADTTAWRRRCGSRSGRTCRWSPGRRGSRCAAPPLASRTRS